MVDVEEDCGYEAGKHSFLHRFYGSIIYTTKCIHVNLTHVCTRIATSLFKIINISITPKSSLVPLPSQPPSDLFSIPVVGHFLEFHTIESCSTHSVGLLSFNIRFLRFFKLLLCSLLPFHW